MAIGQRCYSGRIGPAIQEWAKVDLLYGRSTMGGLVDDAMCAVDYLVSQCPDVDPEGIGMTGFSLGGIVTFYSAVVDPRIRAAAPVCGGIGSLQALEDHGNTGYHSAYFYVPGILKVGDHADLLAAIAPRALLVVGAEEDVAVPLDSVQELERRGHQTYSDAGRSEAFAVRVQPGGHNLTPEALDTMEAWFRQHLSQD
jgi:dienelactone hydrolase